MAAHLIYSITRNGEITKLTEKIKIKEIVVFCGISNRVHYFAYVYFSVVINAIVILPFWEFFLIAN